MAADFENSMIETDEGLLDDIIIHFETIEDNFEKSIARYDYPFADGADLEDMGQKAHTIRFRCWFWDDADNLTYADHTELLDSLKTTDLLDFIHPKYGLLKGKIESIAVNHNDAVRAVSIDLTFVEQMRADLSVAQADTGVLSACEEAYQAAQAEQEALLSDDLAAILPTSDGAAVTDTLDASKSLLTQMQDYSGRTWSAVAQAEKCLATAEATVNEVESPANSLQSVITYSQTLPGRILGRIASAIEKTARLYDSLWNYPSQFIAKLDDAFDDLQSRFEDLATGTSSVSQQVSSVMCDHLRIACAQRIALEAAAIYADDNKAANDTTGESEFQVMTINELENTLAVVRGRLAAAVDIARDMDSLKTMSAALLTQVNSVRLEREKMIEVALDNTMPLHLVCLKYGLSYRDAERLLKVNNSIQNPNFTAGVIKVYA